MPHLSQSQRQKLRQLALDNQLKLVIAYGSRVKGTADSSSDLDLAVMGRQELDFKQILSLTNACIDIFRNDNLDLKSLHHQSPFFLYEVMMNSQLLFGQEYDYESFKSYVYKLHHDSLDLLKLKELLVKKRLSTLT